MCVLCVSEYYSLCVCVGGCGCVGVGGWVEWYSGFVWDIRWFHEMWHSGINSDLELEV